MEVLTEGRRVHLQPGTDQAASQGRQRDFPLQAGERRAQAGHGGCGDCDLDGTFELGLDIMFEGLEGR